MYSDEEEVKPYLGLGRRFRSSGLVLPPRKKNVAGDPLTHHGRHFGRTCLALCNVQALVVNGAIRLLEHPNESDESFTPLQNREHRIFLELLKMVPGLRERVVEGSEEEILDAAHSIQKGVDAARADDTKSLKVVVLRWITPPGQALQPPLYPDQKRTRGFKHPRTGELLCPVEYDWKDPEIRRQLKEDLLVPSGDSWPILLYADFVYDPDDPWKGLFRSSLLVKAFKHIFTSPSSANEYRNDDKSVPKSGNARIHGMMEVTRASIAYVAMQLRFSLCTANMFSRNDKLTDSGRFYDSIMELLEDEDEQVEVEELLEWWNGQVFPGWSRIAVRKPASENSPLAKIRKARALKKAAEAQAIAAGETTVTPAAPKVYVIDDSDVE